MKIVVTGGSGTVGRGLIPLLHKKGIVLLLVGRNPAALELLFPQIANCSYRELASEGRNFDCLLHLATLNNDVETDADAYFSANVEFSLKVADDSKLAEIDRFVFVSTTHALDDKNLGPYAESKRQAARALSAVNGLNLEVIYLPAVQTGHWAGKFAPLNKLPDFAANMIYLVFSALKATLDVKKLADFLSMKPVAVQSEFRPQPSRIITDNKDNNLTYRAFRWALDFAFVAIIVVLFWWALVAIWFAVKITSDGPGIFAQRRIGRNGKEFTCLKFRTMKVGTVQAGTHEVSQSSVTRVGAFLRKFKFDELPQIWNIFRGEVTLIGPRPCLPSQIELIELRRAQDVFRLKPGISGLAQINSVDMSDPVKLVQWDARYLALRSIILDVKICIATVLGRGKGDRVSNAA